MKSVKKSEVLMSRVRLAARIFSGFGFKAITPVHWEIDLQDGRLEYWPQKRIWDYNGIKYVGDPNSLLKFIYENGGKNENTLN